MLIENLCASYRLINISCLPNSVDFNIIVDFPLDISEVFPYLNRKIRGAHYAHKEKILDFMLRKHIITLTPLEMKVTGVKNQDHARSVLEELEGLISSTWKKRDEIEPCYETLPAAGLLDLFKLLPRTNCGECQCPTCMAFAAKLLKSDAQPSACVPLTEPEMEQNLRQISQMLG